MIKLILGSDVMNCFYDGKYLEISKYLNFKDIDIKHVGNETQDQ